MTPVRWLALTATAVIFIGAFPVLSQPAVPPMPEPVTLHGDVEATDFEPETSGDEGTSRRLPSLVPPPVVDLSRSGHAADSPTPVEDEDPDDEDMDDDDIDDETTDDPDDDGPEDDDSDDDDSDDDD